MATNSIFMVDYTNPGLRPFSDEHRDDDQYLVEALLGTRVHRGKKQYLVSWVGEWSPAEKTTWEPAKNVSKEIFQELKRSGVVLPSYPGNDGYRLGSKDDVRDLDGPDDSGSEYDPDDDKDKAHVSSKAKARLPKKSDKANSSRKAKARLAKNSSNVSDDASPSSDQPGDDSGSPVIAATQSEQIDREQIDDGHARALKGAAWLAQAKADLETMDAEWEGLHGETLKYDVPEILRQGAAMVHPAAQQPIQPSTAIPNGLVNFNYNPMMQQAAQWPYQAPTVTPNGFVNFAQQPCQAPPTVSQNGLLNLFQHPAQANTVSQPSSANFSQQPVQAPIVRQPGCADFALNPIPTANDDTLMDDFINSEALEDPSDSDEDAEGSVISEGEQARYDAMSPRPRM